MKKILAALFLLLSSTAFAGLTSYQGQGSAQQYCTANESSFCLDEIKQQADQQARQQSEQQCEVNRGTVVSDGFCNETCNPNYILPSSPSTWVFCNASCTIECNTPE